MPFIVLCPLDEAINPRTLHCVGGAALGQHLAALEQHVAAAITPATVSAVCRWHPLQRLLPGQPCVALPAGATASSASAIEQLCLGQQVSASAALKANAEARTVIANGFQMWFTCELLSLEQQVQTSE